MPRGKGSLQQGLEIGALAVLHVIDMPRPRRRVLDPPHETGEAPCLVDIAGLDQHHEDGVDPLHRYDADNRREGPSPSLRKTFSNSPTILSGVIFRGEDRLRGARRRIEPTGCHLYHDPRRWQG